MRRPVGLLAVLLLLLAFAGCGIPDETAVVVRGSGPPPGLGDGGDNTNRPSKRGDTLERGKFVQNYLAAAAGSIAESADNVREFLAPASRGSFQPEQEINVVRLTEEPLFSPGSDAVTLRVQHVGVLRANGALEPPIAQETTYTLQLSEAEGGEGFYVTKPPQLLLLSETALADFYQPRSIYFWKTDHGFLVPDLRYLPNEVSREKAPTQILQWLIGGPSSWLAAAVAPLPDGTAVTGNVVPDAATGLLQIGLTAAAVPTTDRAALDRLGWQLMWSMRPNLDKGLIVKIAGQPDAPFTGADYLSRNPSFHLVATPERFCVYQGRVSRVISPGGPTGPVPLITDKENHDVRTAGMSRAGSATFAALVVADRADQKLVVGAARDGRPAGFQTAPLPRGAVSRPVWLTALSGGDPGRGTGLLAVDGQLYRFTSNGVEPRRVALPGITGGVTAVAAAPDGYRIAFVAAGNVYVTWVSLTETDVRAAPVRQVRTSLGKLTGVDWSGENSLVVAGERGDTGRVAIFDVTLDGGLETERLPDLGNAQVSHLAAYPTRPEVTRGVGVSAQGAAVTYVANQVSYELTSPPEPIDASEVLGGALPGNPPTGPAAPFFLR